MALGSVVVVVEVVDVVVVEVVVVVLFVEVVNVVVLLSWLIDVNVDENVKRTQLLMRFRVKGNKSYLRLQSPLFVIVCSCGAS